MELKDLWKSLDETGRSDLAQRCGTTPDYLYLIALGHKKAGHALVNRIVAETGGQIDRADLRPDIFGPSAQPPAPDQAKAA